MGAAFLGLGSNLGGREENLERALRLLQARGFRLTRRSAVYETEPVGGPPQADYLNLAAGGDWQGEPEALLAACLSVEAEMGRVRLERFGPRRIDVDLLLFGDLVRTGALELPHPRLHERRFVLLPLAEIAPGAVHPVLGASVAELLARCPDLSRVSKHAVLEHPSR